MALFQEHVDAGFALLYENLEKAESVLEAALVPVPSGDVTKPKPDGRVKHRLIQDQHRSGVNSPVKLPERQVLPWPEDHACDLALAFEDLCAGKEVWSLALDFSNVFMSIPLHPAERQFNCAVVPEATNSTSPRRFRRRT